MRSGDADAGAVVESLLRCGVNRVSLGVQSFVDQEAAAVGRLHKRATVLEDIARLTGGGNYEHQHRSHRRVAAPDRRKLGILSAGNSRDRRADM